MDIMLDLETLGVRCGSVILSIGACAFNRCDGHGYAEFHRFLKPKGQMQVGATIDPSTVLWWLGQSDKARVAMIAGQETAVQPMEALLALTEWVDSMIGAPADRKYVKVWANGADFDLALLTDLYRRYGLEAPWPYNGARDMRTVMDLAGCKPADFEPPPQGAHDALVDALYQARVTAKALERIAGRR